MYGYYIVTQIRKVNLYKMKRCILILFLIITWVGYGQKNQTVLISNGQNYDKSIFADVELKEMKTIYSMEVEGFGLNRYDFINAKEKELSNADKKWGWTALSFSLEDDTGKITEYYFPVSREVMRNGLENINNVKKAKLDFVIYKTDSTPIVIIDRIIILD